jgi:putative transposase
MNYRAITGRAEQNVSGPCARFEIDATIADVFLVSRYNKRYIIGRPTIYVVIDVYSRMITGIYVGWEPPSWEGARLALTNAFSNKVEYCAEYGIKIKPEDWPCQHLPQRLLADRGEIIGDAPTGMIDNLDIAVENTPPYRGDLKGVVESRFAILNGDPIEDLPAAIDGKTGTRGAPDPRLDAALDVHEFTTAIIEAVLHHNKFNEKPALLSKGMIADNILPNPIHIWNWGLQNASGSVEIFDIDAVRLHLYREGKASVRGDGIHFKNMRYTASLAIAEDWFSRARTKGAWQIDIRYDNTTTNNIWYFDKDTAKMERCDLMDSEARYHNMRMEEVANLIEQINASDQLRQDAAAQSNAAKNTRRAENNKDASAQAKAARAGMSKASQTSGLRDNRQVETTIDRAIRGNKESLDSLTGKGNDDLPIAKVVPIKNNDISSAQHRSQAKLLDLLKQQQRGTDDEL